MECWALITIGANLWERLSSREGREGRGKNAAPTDSDVRRLDELNRQTGNGK